MDPHTLRYRTRGRVSEPSVTRQPHASAMPYYPEDLLDA